MAGRASIVGAAATHVGNVRDHNEDAHFLDADEGVFLVCDGMGGHAAGEVASGLAIRTIRTRWASDDTQKLIDVWLRKGSPDARKQMLAALREGVLAAHAAIIEAADNDADKDGMGTTLVGAMSIGNELVFAHAGDSRAYLVRDGIAVQLTEDHTLLARLLAAGIEVDTSGEGARFRSMLTNALGIGKECKVSTFVVPLADGDRFLFCSDGISEYVKEPEIGEVLTKQPSPARAAQKLVELALERGGNDNATAVVIRVLEAGETPQPAEQIRRDEEVIASCPLWGPRVTPQQRLRALRIAIERDHTSGARLPAQTLGDRVAWILVEGKLVQDDEELALGALVYPEALLADSPLPERDRLAIARTDLRVLALRADDFRELCDDDSELGEALLEGLAALIAARKVRRVHLDEEDAEIDVVPGTDDAAGEDDARDPHRSPTVPSSAIDAAIEAIGDEALGDATDDLLVGLARASEPEIEIQAEPDEPETEPPVEAADEEEVREELDARFDAVFADPDAVPAPIKPTPSGRIPLILRPRAPTDPGAARTPSPRSQSPTVPGGAVRARPETKRPETEPGSGPPPRQPSRPPSEPEIERVDDDDEDADVPQRDAAEDAAVEMTIEADEPDDGPAAPDEVAVDDGQIRETVEDTSAATLTVTVDDDDSEPGISAHALPDPTEDAEEPTSIKPRERKLVVVSGRISTDEPISRKKRVSDGWGDE